MSTSVSPEGNPVLVDCLAARLYAFTALLLSFGCPGRPDVTAANPTTITSRTRLKLGIAVLCDEITLDLSVRVDKIGQPDVLLECMT